MTDDLRERLRITDENLHAINALLLDPDTRVVNAFLDVLNKYGTPEEINRQAEAARQLPSLLSRLAAIKSPYLDDLKWLTEQRERGAFISIPEYRRKVLGPRAAALTFADDFAVTLEISAFQYFPWLITEAKQAIANGELMPGRFIRVRKMKESEADEGDLLAVVAAMQIVGASYVETLDTKGTDGSNVHLGGPATLTGYFGGVGQPNEYPLKWLDEFLYYYTHYGVTQVLNLNPGTVLAGYLLHKLGVNNEFKISVFMGNDNPYAVLWTLIGAKLFARPDPRSPEAPGAGGRSPLIGFNFSNSVNNETIELCAEVRRALDFESVVRFEHHITETWKSIVRQPYDRRAELVEIAGHVANISAKHEGGDPEVEPTLDHPSDILDYFRDKAEVLASGHMPLLERNYLEKHAALNHTARALTEHGLSFVAARHLHRACAAEVVPAQVE
ncbi:MAG TPA: hypothetical protein VJG32_09475 [Anaerolineae bacterium]|nr:hypothetical protein [Anaerolineae bacterium]